VLVTAVALVQVGVRAAPTATGTTSTTGKFDYNGNALSVERNSAGAALSSYYYTSFGDLECVTRAATPHSACDNWNDDATRSPDLQQHYTYDGLDRMLTGQQYKAAKLAGGTSVVYDGLNRPRQEKDQMALTGDPAGATPTDVTNINYIGLTDLVSQDKFAPGRKDPQGASLPATTRDYAYDADGQRTTMTATSGTAGTPQELSYGFDAHGSVSLLLDSTGQAKAAYGYQAYGEPITSLTSEQALDSTNDAKPNDPTNRYRYSDKRLDPTTNTLDMGARRFGPNTATFLQADKYEDALGDLALNEDPLTTNRYSLAAGNPVSFIETDGHRPAFDNAGAARKAGRKKQHIIPARPAPPAPRRAAPDSATRRAAAGPQARDYTDNTTDPGDYRLPSPAEERKRERSVELVHDPHQSLLGSLINPTFITRAGDEDTILENGAGEAIAKLILKGARNRAAEIARARELGAEGEEAAGIVGRPKEVFASATGTAKRRFPDYVDRNRAVLGEIKNVGHLSYTAQLRDYAAIAQREGLSFELRVRRSTTFTRPLADAIRRGDVTLSPKFIGP
jgi:RHS repeat-associated protein